MYWKELIMYLLHTLLSSLRAKIMSYLCLARNRHTHSIFYELINKSIFVSRAPHTHITGTQQVLSKFTNFVSYKSSLVGSELGGSPHPTELVVGLFSPSTGPLANIVTPLQYTDRYWG